VAKTVMTRVRIVERGNLSPLMDSGVRSRGYDGEAIFAPVPLPGASVSRTSKATKFRQYGAGISRRSKKRSAKRRYQAI